jgi:hypothetical protein
LSKATTTKKVIKAAQYIPAEEETIYNLELTEKEAHALHALLGSVSYNPGAEYNTYNAFVALDSVLGRRQAKVVNAVDGKYVQYRVEAAS